METRRWGRNRRGSSAGSVATGAGWGGDACVMEVSGGEDRAGFGDGDHL